MRVVVGPVQGFLALASPAEAGIARTALVEIHTHDGLFASRTVQQDYASGFADLADYFERLAQDWKGWRGSREWRSLEGELQISAVHDGHIRLELELRGPFPQDWLVRCEIALEPGEQLSAAATDLRAFANSYDSSI